MADDKLKREAETGAGHSASSEPELDFLRCERGLWSWLSTLDHKRIGIMYLLGITISFLLGGAFALLVRLELFEAGQQYLTAKQYNQYFTVHGAIMVFLVIIPGLPAAIGNFAVPLQLGAPDVAFPRLNLASFYLWCGGAAMLLWALATSAPDTGWTFYTPYSLEEARGGTSTNAVAALMGVFILGFSSIFTGLNFIVTIHKFKPRGMGWFKMPLNLWGIYSTAVIQVLATPVIGLTVGLLAIERVFGIGIFDPGLGGDPVLFQHFFWFYSHPAVYIMILPAMAIMSDLITTFAHKHIFGYRFIAYSSVSLALLSFLVWGHHMFVSGQSRLASMVFSALTFTVAIPSAIKVFNWTATLYKAKIVLKTPMLYALSFILLFTIGGLTGIFLGALNVDIHLHDTYFVVAHFHYVMMGSALIAFLGALHYYWPKMFGKMYNETVAKLCAIGVFIFFNWTFLPQFVMGSRGMPRRYFDYDIVYEGYHQASSIGAFLMGITLFISFVNLAASFWTGRKAPRNPWGATTLEWQAPTPPTKFNFPENEPPPVLYEIYDYSDLEYDPKIDGWYRKSERALEEAKIAGRGVGAADEAEVEKAEAEALHEEAAERRARAEETGAKKGEQPEAEAERAELEAEAKEAEAEEPGSDKPRAKRESAVDAGWEEEE